MSGGGFDSNLQSFMAGQSSGSQYGPLFWIPELKGFTGLDIGTIGPAAVFNKMINPAAVGGMKFLPTMPQGLLSKLLADIKGRMDGNITYLADGIVVSEVGGVPYLGGRRMDADLEIH